MILGHEKKENGIVGYGTTSNKAWFALKYANKHSLKSVKFEDLPDEEKIAFWNKGLV